MLTDYEDDFFFEEDKMLVSVDCTSETKQSQAAPAASPTPSEELQVEKLDDVFCRSFPDCNQQRFGFNAQKAEMERLGMTVTTGSVTIKKDQTNLIGISIGGGAPLCPCLYIVQVFDGTPAAAEGSLQSGDELLGINGAPVKGKTKVEVAKMIQGTSDEVVIHYNKLHADPSQGETLDIILKKLKHRVVDAMSSSTADTLGLSRAILCNDSLVKRLQELEGTEYMYKGLVEHCKRMLKAYFDYFQGLKGFGDCFADVSVREPQARASEAFRLFSEFHRQMEKDGVEMIKSVKPVLSDMGTYLNKAIPDTKLTVRKYTDAKFSYLSYCLKVKEMDDEEHSFAAIQEPLYRVETGNYEYRLILRCRQEARVKFANLRNDVLEKMELLENKHAHDLGAQLRKILEGIHKLLQKTHERIQALPPLFPIEVDLKDNAFQYPSSTLPTEEYCDEGQEVNCGEEAVETPAAVIEGGTPLLEGFEDVNLGNSSAPEDDLLGAAALQQPSTSTSVKIPPKAEQTTDELLIELGLAGIDLSATGPSLEFGDFQQAVNLMD